MDINVNTRKVKYAMDQELSVTDVSLIKVSGYFKIFKCGKELFNNLDVTYERAWMGNAKDEYWMEIYDTITNYNDRNHTPLSKTNII